MTHIRSALVAALLTFGAAAVASAQSAPPTTQAPARAQHQRGLGRHHHGAQAFLKGISLSDAEKANLKSVRGKYDTQMKALRQQNKPQMQAMRDARQRGDTAGMKALWEKNAGSRQQTKQLMQAERADVRAALSPENQTKFDSNVQSAKAHVDKRAQKKGGAGAPSAASF